jgi:hypothetical protein
LAITELLPPKPGFSKTSSAAAFPLCWTQTFCKGFLTVLNHAPSFHRFSLLTVTALFSLSIAHAAQPDSPCKHALHATWFQKYDARERLIFLTS